MASKKWSEQLVEKWNNGSVPEQIDEIQRLYGMWCWLPVCIAALGGGLLAVSQNTKMVGGGVCLVLIGILNVTLLKLWAHTKLSMLRIVWEMRKQE